MEFSEYCNEVGWPRFLRHPVYLVYFLRADIVSTRTTDSLFRDLVILDNPNWVFILREFYYIRNLLQFPVNIHKRLQCDFLKHYQIRVLIMLIVEIGEIIT